MALNINPRNPRVLIGILGKFAFSADVAIFPVFFLVFLIQKSIFGLKTENNIEQLRKIATSAENANLPKIPIKTRGFLGFMLRATLLN